PILGVVIERDAEIVAAHVGGIVPGDVVDGGPIEELGARIVGVTVVVEGIGRRHLPEGDGQAVDVAIAGNGVRPVLDLLLLAAEVGQPRWNIQRSRGASGAPMVGVGELTATGAPKAARTGPWA